MSNQFTPEELEQQYRIARFTKDVIYDNMVDTVYRDATHLVEMLMHDKKELTLLANSFDLPQAERINSLPDQIDEIEVHPVLEDLFKRIVERVLGSLGWEYSESNGEWTPPGYSYLEGYRPKAVSMMNRKPYTVPASYKTLAPYTEKEEAA